MADSELLVGLMAVRDHLVSPDEFKNAARQWQESKASSFLEILNSVRSLDDGILLSLKQFLSHYLQTTSESEIFAARLADQLNLADCLFDGSANSQKANHLAVSDLFSEVETEQYSGNSRDSTGRQIFSGAMNRRDISRFQNVRRYREGGLGTVSTAVDSDFDRLVALKQIRSDKVGNELVQAKFEFEAAVTGQLEHPGIVPIYCKGLDQNDQPYYVMKFIRGNTLGEEIKEFHNTRKELPSSQSMAKLRSLLRRFVDVCETMAYAHSRGILHRDIKPDNIMLGNYGETLVVDWGLAKADKAKQDPSNRPSPSDNEVRSISISSEYHQYSEMLAGSFQGTITHASPEQLRALDGQLSVRSDVYSLGVVLHNTLTGKLPTERQPTPESMADAIKNRTPDWNGSDVSNALAAICDKALAYDPSDRYESAESLRDDVQNWLDDQPVSAYKDTWRESAGRWTRNHPRLAASLLVGVLAIIGSGVAVSMVQQRAEANRLLAAKEHDLELAKQDKKASLENALRFAVSRANFNQALEITQELEKMDGRISANVALDRAESFFGLQDTNKAKETLANLARNELSPRNQTRYDLLDALVGIDTDAVSDKASRTKLEAIIAGGNLLLDEEELAKGLLAQSSKEAIEHFLVSRDANPYRADTHAYLAMNQILAGRLLDAEKSIRIAKLIVADDPRLEFEQALIYGLRGDIESARNTAQALPQSSEWQLLSEVVDFLAVTLNGMSENLMNESVVSQNILLMTRAVPLISKMMQLDNTNSVRLPLSGIFGNAKAALKFPDSTNTIALTIWFSQIGKGEIAARLATVFPDHPLLLSIQALQLADKWDIKLGNEAEELIARRIEIDNSWSVCRKLDAMSLTLTNASRFRSLQEESPVRSKWLPQQKLRSNVNAILEQTEYADAISMPLLFDALWLLMLRTCNIPEALETAEDALVDLRAALPDGAESTDEIQLWERRLAATEEAANQVDEILKKAMEENSRPITP